MAKAVLVKKGSGVKVQRGNWATSRVQVSTGIKRHLSRLKPNTKFEGELVKKRGAGKKDAQQVLELTKIHKIL